MILDALAEEYHFSLETPFEEYSDKIKDGSSMEPAAKR